MRPGAHGRSIVPAAASLALVAACSWACSRSRGSPPTSAESREASRPEDAAVEASTADGQMPPLEAPEPLALLPVPGFGDAQVSLPIGARTRRPVVLVAHGIWDPPDIFCPLWRTIAGDHVFVLCPRGIRNPNSSPTDPVYMYASNAALEREIDAALEALHARYPDHVDLERPVYAGFSQSSTMGAAIVRRNPKRFSRVVFVEGASRWTPAQAAAFRRAGGQRVLHACGQPGCLAPSREATRVLERAGLEARMIYAEGMGHTSHGRVGEAIGANFLPWLVADDSRFAR